MDELAKAMTDLKEQLSVVLSEVLLLRSENADLKAENASLKAENAELLARLGLNSKNSSKPPSSDGLQKAAIAPALPKEKGKTSGGQKGHVGKTLNMVCNPDRTIIHHAPCCLCCHKVFKLSDIESVCHRRQVFDIPPPKLVVTEHQLGITRCCGQRYIGEFPPQASSLVQYGSQIKALSVLLNTDYKIPFDKIEQLFADLYGCSFNESTAISANTTCYTNLASVEQDIKTAILGSEVVHFDETGMRVAGKLHWFHVACTALFTYLFVHAKRGGDTLVQDEASLIKDFQHIAIHDCWKTYFGLTNCFHALCNAHILRELEHLIEQGSPWAKDMKQYLLELYLLSEKATIIVPNQALWIEKYQLICRKADEYEPPPIKGKRGKPKSTKGRNLLNRLTDHQDGILAFAFTQIIPFTNNQAERDIRGLKTKQKVATAFHTFNGAQQYARIQAVISTLRKHNMNVFQHLCHSFNKKSLVFAAA